MHKIAKEYTSLWKFDLLFVVTLVIDALTWVVGGGLLSVVAYYFQTRALQLAAGNDAATIQEYMLSLPPDQLAVFSADLRVFVIQFVAALIILPIALVVLYAASRSLLSNIVERNHWKVIKLHKWVATVVLLIVILALYAGAAVLVRQMLIILPLRVFAVLYSIVLAAALVHVLMLAFLAKRNVARTHMVWSSIGDAFAELKKKKRLFLYGTLTLILLQVVQIPLKNWFFIYPTYGIIVQLFIFVLFSSWLRMATLRK